MNACSIVCNAKRTSLNEFLYSRDVDICFITETWLKEKHPVGFLNEFELKYDNIRCDRKEKGGGGVAAIFKKSLKIIEKLNYSDTSGFEILVLDVIHSSRPEKKSRFICSYRPPSLNLENTNKMLSTIQKFITADNSIVLGDLNFPLVNWESMSLTRACPIHQIFIDFCIVNGLMQHVPRPTRITKTSANILDIVLNNTIDAISKVTVSENPCFSDHLLVSFKTEMHTYVKESK